VPLHRIEVAAAARVQPVAFVYDPVECAEMVEHPIQVPGRKPPRHPLLQLASRQMVARSPAKQVENALFVVRYRIERLDGANGRAFGMPSVARLRAVKIR